MIGVSGRLSSLSNRPLSHFATPVLPIKVKRKKGSARQTSFLSIHHVSTVRIYLYAEVSAYYTYKIVIQTLEQLPKSSEL